MKISQIFWIVHPAFTLDPYKGQPQHTPKEIEDKLDKLFELAYQITRDPTAVVAVVRTPFLKSLPEEEQVISRRRLIEAKENALIKKLAIICGKRLIVSSQHGQVGLDAVKNQLKEQIHKKSLSSMKTQETFPMERFMSNVQEIIQMN